MVKPFAVKSALGIVLIAAAIGAAVWYSIAPRKHLIPDTKSWSATGRSEMVWSRTFDGFISDLSVGASSGRALVATLPDRESLKRSHDYTLSLIERDGTVLWTRSLSNSVRKLALSSDGLLAVVNDYEGRLKAFDSHGRELWDLEANCEPMIGARIVCFHDEDSDSDIAFDLLDRGGRKLVSVPAKGEVLSLKVAPDQSSIVVGTAGGKITAYDASGQEQWETTIAGEVSDLAAAADWIAVLHDAKEPRREQLLTVLSAQNGTSRWSSPITEWKIPGRIEQVERGDADTFWTYSREGSGRSRRWAIRAWTMHPAPRPLWTDQSVSGGGEWLLPLGAYDSMGVVAIDGRQAPDRQSLLRVYQARENRGWEIKAGVPEDGNLYLFDYAPGGAKEPGLAFVAMDEGKLMAFRLLPL